MNLQENETNSLISRCIDGYMVVELADSIHKSVYSTTFHTSQLSLHSTDMLAGMKVTGCDDEYMYVCYNVNNHFALTLLTPPSLLGNNTSSAYMFCMWNSHTLFYNFLL